jgi:hypothetical protein
MSIATARHIASLFLCLSLRFLPLFAGTYSYDELL